jgi:hypothetical protein
VNVGGTILDSVFKDKRADQRSSLRDQPQLDQSWLRARRLRGTLFDYSLPAISEDVLHLFYQSPRVRHGRRPALSRPPPAGEKSFEAAMSVR